MSETTPNLPESYLFGPDVTPNGTRFRLWAPTARRVDLVITEIPAAGHNEQTVVKLPRLADGWYISELLPFGPGTRYQYRIDRNVDVPDPASRFQPEGVHGPSELVDLKAIAAALDSRTIGRRWEESVIYELHVGTFSPEGTYAAVADHLERLRDLGITVVQLMPLAAFPGSRNWGYDGVLPFAPAAAYGAPTDLVELISTAHRLGLTVFHDVVYNHFGPEGNYLHLYADPFFTEKVQTPWGVGIDFAVPEVRRFFLENATLWTQVYGFDGLRIDAVHAIYDKSEPHFVDQLGAAMQSSARERTTGRQLHVVLENEDNDVDRLEFASAQWNDDLHHLIHVLVTGEDEGYYRDYSDDPHCDIAKTLAEGFFFQGQASTFRNGESRGTSSGGLSPTSFVSFCQNHDQIGNRAFGERLGILAREPRIIDAIYALILLAPQIPLLFMGEEIASRSPFLFFCDFDGDLADAVCEGRRREFTVFSAFSDPTTRATIPDPNDLRTFTASRIEWSGSDQRSAQSRFTHIQDLLAIRRSRLVPLLSSMTSGAFFGDSDSAMRISWPAGNDVAWVMIYNLTDTPRVIPSFPPSTTSEIVFSSADTRRPVRPGDLIDPWSVIVTLEGGANDG